MESFKLNSTHRLSVCLLPPHLSVQMKLSRARPSRAAHDVVVELRSFVDISVLRSLGYKYWLVWLGHQPKSENDFSILISLFRLTIYFKLR